jgi:hypothetical protein
MQAQADGLTAIETGGNKTLESVAKALADVEVSDYTTTLTATAAAGSTTITVTSTAKFSRGDYVQVKDNNGSELGLITSVDSSTKVTLEKTLGSSYTVAASGVLNTCVEYEALLL